MTLCSLPPPKHIYVAILVSLESFLFAPKLLIFSSYGLDSSYLSPLFFKYRNWCLFSINLTSVVYERTAKATQWSLLPIRWPGQWGWSSAVTCSSPWPLLDLCWSSHRAWRPGGAPGRWGHHMPNFLGQRPPHQTHWGSSWPFSACFNPSSELSHAKISINPPLIGPETLVDVENLAPEMVHFPLPFCL